MKPRFLDIGVLTLLAFACGCGSDSESSESGDADRANETVTDVDSATPGSAQRPDGSTPPIELKPAIPESDTARVLPDSSTRPAETATTGNRTVYRLSFPGRETDEATLRRNGLVRLRLKHLDLITDLTPDVYEPLLPLPDAMLATWEG